MLQFFPPFSLILLAYIQNRTTVFTGDPTATRPLRDVACEARRRPEISHSSVVMDAGCGCCQLLLMSLMDQTRDATMTSASHASLRRRTLR